MAETNQRPGEHAAAEWYRQDLELIEGELLTVLQTHWARVGSQLIAHAAVETVGSVLAAIIRDKPAAQADVLGRLDQLRLHLTAGESRPQ